MISLQKKKSMLIGLFYEQLANLAPNLRFGMATRMQSFLDCF